MRCRAGETPGSRMHDRTVEVGGGPAGSATRNGDRGC